MSGTAKAEVRREMPLILIQKIPSKTSLVQTQEKSSNHQRQRAKFFKTAKLRKNIERICFAKVYVF